MAAAAPPPQDPRWQDQRYVQRAQRDAWKAQQQAQRDAYQAQRRYYRGFRRPSLAGPMVLVAVGIVFLLLQTGRLNRYEFWNWYGRWWPLLLIGVGVVTLIEWFIDRNSPYPARRSIGGIIFLLIIFSGIGGISHSIHNLGPIAEQFGDSKEDFSFFQGPEHSHDQQIITEMPEQPAVQIQNPHGDVIIAASSDSQMHIDAHEVAHASSENDAAKLFPSLVPKVTVSGNSVIVRVEGASSGLSNLSIQLPAAASVNINAGHGDVTISGIHGAANIVSGRGDVKLENLAGSAQTRMSKGDFSAHAIQGELTVEGRGDDLTLSDVHSKVLLDGDFFGDVHLQQMSAPVHFHSSHTDVEFARVDGDMTMAHDDLNMQQVVGPSRIVCRSKEIEGSQMSGDIHLENNNGDVTISSVAPMGNVQIVNQKGAISFSAPSNASFSVEANSNDGDIDNDFSLGVSGGESSHSMSGQVGHGGPKVTLIANHGDIHLKKGEGLGALPMPPPIPIAPLPPPRLPRGPVKHLKAPQGADEQPTVQQ